jgi:enamine deaminase RidA (YjgF/YER057c/UK114 family)
MLALLSFPEEDEPMGAEARLKEKNITLPTPATPVANYVGAVRAGNMLFVSGHGPLRSDGKPSARGKVGRELSTDQGYQIAREVGLNLLATTRTALGSLDKVRRVVKVLGMVNSAEGFGEQPKVINGFSDLMVEVFGDAIGKHARSAVGMAELPMGIPVEIEMVLEVE